MSTNVRACLSVFARGFSHSDVSLGPLVAESVSSLIRHAFAIDIKNETHKNLKRPGHIFECILTFLQEGLSVGRSVSRNSRNSMKDEQIRDRGSYLEHVMYHVIMQLFHQL